MTDDAWHELPADEPVAGARWTPSPAEPLRPARRRLLLGVGVAPWVALGIGLLARSDPAPASAPPGVPATPASTPPSATDTPPAPTSAATEVVRVPIAATDDRLHAVAVQTVHTSTRTGEYVDHAVVEGVHHPRPDAAVVVVRAGVLRRVGDVWDGPTLVRRAVPVLVDTDPVAAGAPWPLPPPPTGVTTIDVEPVDDPALADEVAAALTDAGWSGVVVTAVGVTGQWPLVAEVRAIAPDEHDPRDHHLWMERLDPGLRLVGDPTRRQGATP